MKKHPVKLCFCASSGGHYWELLQLKSLANKYESFCITEKMTFNMENLCEKTYYLPQVNRKMLTSIVLLFVVLIKIFVIVIKERPCYIISSGAFFTYPVMLFGKLFGVKILFIESLARTSSKSLTGKLAYPFADIFIVQWDSMFKIYPKAKIGRAL